MATFATIRHPVTSCCYPSTRIKLKGNRSCYTSALTYVSHSITFVLNKYSYKYLDSNFNQKKESGVKP